MLSEFLSQRELFEFDENGLPNPPSEQELDELITNFSLELNEDLCACSVCDELRPKSECAFVCPCQLKASFFRVLKSPTNKELRLHPRLEKDYDVSDVLQDERFRGMLLSPRGIAKECEQFPSCNSLLRLTICKPAGCYPVITKGSCR